MIDSQLNQQAQYMAMMAQARTQAASAKIPLKIWMRVLVIDRRPYREANIVAMSARYTDSPEFVRVRYGPNFLGVVREEWLHSQNVSPIGVAHED